MIFLYIAKSCNQSIIAIQMVFNELHNKFICYYNESTALFERLLTLKQFFQSLSKLTEFEFFTEIGLNYEN